jgi:hypothetical protein
VGWRGKFSGMNIETIREWRNRCPFQPFEVHLTNGEAHTVWEPQNVALGKTQIIIACPAADRIVLCDLSRIDAIEATASI